MDIGLNSRVMNLQRTYKDSMRSLTPESPTAKRETVKAGTVVMGTIPGSASCNFACLTFLTDATESAF